jgi:putative membrane protein
MLTACRRHEDSGDPSEDTHPEGGVDAVIVSIARVSSEVEIDAARLAAARTADPDVKAFAYDMLRDHGAALDALEQLGVRPEKNLTGQTIVANGQKELARLRRLSGVEFDAAYVDEQVAFHQAILDELDRTLIPRARATALKAALTAFRPVMASHLAHAKMLQEKRAREPVSTR